jgi:hypothetical protein
MHGKSFLEEYAPILKKYKDGGDVTDPQDFPKIEVLTSLGLMKNGISTKRVQITAKTTSTGLGLITN